MLLIYVGLCFPESRLAFAMYRLKLFEGFEFSSKSMVYVYFSVFLSFYCSVQGKDLH